MEKEIRLCEKIRREKGGLDKKKQVLLAETPHADLYVTGQTHIATVWHNTGSYMSFYLAWCLAVQLLDKKVCASLRLHKQVKFFSAATQAYPFSFLYCTLWGCTLFAQCITHMPSLCNDPEKEFCPVTWNMTIFRELFIYIHHSDSLQLQYASGCKTII